MLLKMKTSLAGPTISLSREDEHDFDDHREGLRLCNAGFAIPANDQARAELESIRAEVAAEQSAADAIDDGDLADLDAPAANEDPAPAEQPAAEAAPAETPAPAEVAPAATPAPAAEKATKPRAAKKA